MTLLPEPREVRTLHRERRSPADRHSDQVREDRFDERILEFAPTMQPLVDAVSLAQSMQPLVGGLAHAQSILNDWNQIVIAVADINWDLLVIVSTTGTRDRRFRRMRKRAHIRIRHRARAAGIATQPSSKGSWR